MAVDAQGSVAEILSFNGQVKSDRRPETSRMTFERGIPFFRWGGQINLAAFQSLAPKSLQSEKIISRQWPPKANPHFISIFLRQIVLLPIAKEKMVFHFKNAS